MTTNKAKARITWNRLSKTILYDSLNEKPKIHAVYKKQNKCFVLIDCKIDDTGYYPGDVNHKLENIQQYLQKNYGNRIQ